MAFFSQYYNQNNPMFSQENPSYYTQSGINSSQLQQPNGLPGKVSAPDGINSDMPSFGSTQQKSNMGSQIGNYANAANIGVQSFTSSAQKTDDYAIDPYAGISGAASGFSGGGWIGAVTGGVGGYLGNYSQVNKNLKNLDTSIQAYNTDQEGNVRYDGQSMVNANNKINFSK